jgi:collagen type III alpha
MSDDDSTAATPDEPTEPVAAPAASSTPEPAAAPVTDERPGFHVPTWLAGVAAVVVALLIGVAGFAIGHSSADDGRGDRPALISDRGGMPGGQQGGQFPGGPGGQQGGQQGGQFPGGPGGQQGGQPGGQQGGPGYGDQGGNTQGRSDGSSGPQASPGPGSSSGQGDTGTRGS